MLRIGLTGGIGAGKSEVVTALAARGAVVVEADKLAREVVAPGTPGLREVVAAFGDAVLTPAGELDRSAVAARVFADPAARDRLEAIVHPRVRNRTEELVAAAPPDAIVVNEVPLLVEVGLAPTYHLVVVVEAAEETRLARLAQGRGLAPDQARQRIRSQAGDAARRAAADVLLSNDGTVADLRAAVDALWRDRLVPYEANLRTGRRAPRARTPVLVDPDPTWPAQAERLIARLRRAAGGRAVRIDHVGSTAVPGLPAKDLLDIQVVVADLGAAAGVAEDARQAGLVRVAGPVDSVDRDGTPAPEEVAVNADPGRPVNVNIRPESSGQWRDVLLLRDWLRADAAARSEYAARKRELAARPGYGVDAYGRDKLPWIRAALARADQWAATTGWHPPDRESRAGSQRVVDRERRER